MEEQLFLTDEIKNLIIDLKVISEISQGDKLNTLEKHLLIDSVSMYQTVKRFIRRDDRSLTYSKIKQILFELQQVIKQYTKESYVNKIKLFEYLYPILNKAHTGLNILKDTYDNDKTFQSKMEVEIHIVEMTIDNLKRELE